MVLGPAACIFPENQRKLYTSVATDVATDPNAHVSPKLVFARNGNRAFLSMVWRQGNAAGLRLNAVQSRARRAALRIVKC
jgi:hypothetical protein